MRAVVAAGDPATVRAAAGVLASGGNAVDAATAGAFAAFVAEPLLASAGGAGMMTLSLPGIEPAVIDFFSSVPGRGGAGDELDFVRVDIDFGSTTQAFHVGRGSVAPPLALPGLVVATERFGRLPLSALVEPAVRMARHGVAITPECAEVFRLLWPIQALSAETTALASGSCPSGGTILRNPQLADLLDEVAATGRTPHRFIEAMLSDFGPAAGGLLSREDLEAAAPIVTTPLQVAIGDWTALTSPRPGGRLVSRILEELFGREGQDRDEAEEALHIANACRAGHEARDATRGRGSTTHISVIDGDGGAASVTLTNGEGCGYVAPGTGVQMNNFLGEEDLNPRGFHRHPAGAPLPTMIAPTIALRGGEPALALGSGGSNRIRSVVSQVLYRVVRGADLDAAVLNPRVHAESDDVWVELADRAAPNAIVETLKQDFERVHPFPDRAFYFGGVHAVLRTSSGETYGVGDPRRGGAVATVELS